MDYEKAYKAVLQTATQWIKDGCTDKEKICLECVFPELRESEDERIRKWLVDYFGSIKEVVWIHRDITCEQILAWLEKQKEQKPNIELIQRSWYMEGYNDREFGMEPKWIIKTGEGGPKHELNPKYGQSLADEQKPVEWSEEDERRIDAICELLENTSAIHPNYSHRKLIIWLKSLRPNKQD